MVRYLRICTTYLGRALSWFLPIGNARGDKRHMVCMRGLPSRELAKVLS